MTRTRPDGWIRRQGWRALGLAFVLHGLSTASAQGDTLTVVADSAQLVVVLDAPPIQETEALDSAWVQRVDSLWWAWCEEAHCVSTDSAIWYAGTDSKALAADLDTAAILRDLADLDRRSTLDLAPHGAVLDRIAFMMRRRPIFLGRMMGRGLQYFPLFEEALDRHGLPLELKYPACAGEWVESIGQKPCGCHGVVAVHVQHGTQPGPGNQQLGG